MIDFRYVIENVNPCYKKLISHIMKNHVCISDTLTTYKYDRDILLTLMINKNSSFIYKKESLGRNTKTKKKNRNSCTN